MQPIAPPIQFRWKQSLQLRCAAYGLLLSSLVITVSGYALFNQLQRNVFDSREDNIDVIANITADVLGLALWNFDAGAATRSLRSLEHIQGFCGARIFDKDRRVFATYGWREEARQDVAPDAKNTQHAMLATFAVKQKNIVFSVSDKARKEVIGILEVCDDRHFIEAALRAQALGFMGPALALTLALGGIVWLALRKVFVPLTQLGSVMQRTHLELKKIETPRLLGHDEIGELGNRFNTMIDRLTDARAQLERKIEEAQEANRAKDLFLSNMSHELRTPLHAILNYSEMGQKQLADNHVGKLSKYLTNIQTAGKRLLNLLNDLLDLSKLRAGKMVLEYHRAPIEKIIEYSASELDSLLQKKGLRFALDNRARDTVISIDTNRLTQVFINIFSNAIRYSPENEAIAVRITEDMHNNLPALRLSFSNCGPAIPEHDLEKIFDAFTQGSADKHAGGSGLGLAICREIIHAHGGRIWAENLAPTGTVFHIVLPQPSHT